MPHQPKHPSKPLQSMNYFRGDGSLPDFESKGGKFVWYSS
jgi:hypothetical protein